MPKLNETQNHILSTPRKLWPDELALDEATYARRLTLIQTEITKAGLSGALFFDPENMFWLTGYQTIGYFTFQAMHVPCTGKPVILTRVVNRDMALALPTIEDAIAVFDTQDHVAVLVEYLNHLRPKQDIGIETTSRYLNIRDFKVLSDALDVSLTPFDTAFDAHRITKTKAELDRMHRAARAAEAGIDAALKTIAPGKTDNDVAAAFYQASIAAGSEYIGHPPMVVSGPRSALCFALWRRNRMAVGDVVLLEGAGCVDRYHAIMARSAVIGRPSSDHRDVAAALIDILETACATIRPGITAGEVDHACRSRAEARGLGQFYKSRAAYGIGIGFPPNWAEGHLYAIKPDDPMVLQPNMTFHVIPTLFCEHFGMAISDSVRVSDTGCEVLTHYPRDLVEVPE